MKAQMKIQQMAFMLLAVTLFFALVGMFVIGVKFSGLKDSATALSEENAMLLATKLANSPEFSCGEAFGSSRTNCIDADKVMALKKNIVKYADFWDVENIEIRKIYPKLDSEIICTQANYPDCNVIRIRSKEVSGFDASNFVSLCRKAPSGDGAYNKCEIGELMISYEKK